MQGYSYHLAQPRQHHGTSPTGLTPRGLVGTPSQSFLVPGPAVATSGSYTPAARYGNGGSYVAAGSGSYAPPMHAVSSYLPPANVGVVARPVCPKSPMLTPRVLQSPQVECRSLGVSVSATALPSAMTRGLGSGAAPSADSGGGGSARWRNQSPHTKMPLVASTAQLAAVFQKGPNASQELQTEPSLSGLESSCSATGGLQDAHKEPDEELLQELGRAKSRAVQLEVELLEARQELDESSAVLGEAQKALVERGQQLAELQNTSTLQLDSILERERQVAVREERVRDREESLELAIAEQQAEAALRAAELSQKEFDIQSQQEAQRAELAEIRKRRDQLCLQERAIQSREQEVEGQLERVRGRRSEVAAAEKVLSERERRLDEELQERSKRLAEREAAALQQSWSGKENQNVAEHSYISESSKQTW